MDSRKEDALCVERRKVLRPVRMFGNEEVGVKSSLVANGVVLMKM
jgi:hypothetical protein